VISHFFIRPLIFTVCASNFAVFMGKCLCKFKAGKGQNPAILLKRFLSILRILFFCEVMLHNWITESQHFKATLFHHFQGTTCPRRMPGAGGNVTVCIGTVYLVVGCLLRSGYDYSSVAVLYHRRLESLATPLQKPETLHVEPSGCILQ
jgi:hypothetical protein